MQNQSIITRSIALLSFLILAFALPSDSLAQPSPVNVTDATSNTAADEVHDKAVALFTDPASHNRAAHLLRQECELRSDEDPLAYRCLAMSARLFYYTGELLDARTMMEKAADNALQRGDVIAAARSYIEAAAIAQEQNRGDTKAEKLIEKARVLSNSPLLNDSQSDRILTRIGVEAPALASGVTRR